MSFSGKIKEELSEQLSAARHCQIAELTAIIGMCGGVSISENEQISLKLKTENRYVVRKFSALIKKIFHAFCEVSVRKRKQSTTYLAAICRHEDSVRILQAVHMLTETGEIIDPSERDEDLVYQRSCCKRSFLRGAFLSSGSVSDPQRAYHFEMVCQTQQRADQLRSLMSSFDLEAHCISRKERFVVYLKEGDQIVNMLGVMEAPRALMEMENIRILKEIGNHVNRQVNCETANLNKTVSAAVAVIRDIEYLRDSGKLMELSASLQETAHLRLAYPDISLSELAALHGDRVGKSGVNHRLKKLSEIAEKERGDSFNTVVDLPTS